VRDVRRAVWGESSTRCAGAPDGGERVDCAAGARAGRGAQAALQAAVAADRTAQGAIAGGEPAEGSPCSCAVVGDGQGGEERGCYER